MTFEWPRNGQIEDLVSQYHQVLAGDRTHSQEVVVVFPENAWIEPASVCAFALEVLRNEKVKHTFRGHADVLDYLSRLNFFRIIGVKYTENFKRHPDAGRIIPLQTVKTQSEVHHAVRLICDMVSRHLANAREFIPAMEWTVNEIIDNITTHSATVLPGLVSAQYYPELKRIRIGITDAGRGIRATLAERYLFEKDFEAIDKAVERGVTRNLEIGQGNGLAGSVEIANLNKGELAILSGMGYYRVSKTTTNRGRSKSNIRGTVVSLNLNADQPVDLMKTFMAESATGWTYFDAEAQRILEADGLKVREEIVHSRGREPAKALRNKIKGLVGSIEDGRKLPLDFTGVESPSSSFLDELLGRLVVELTPSVFRAKIDVLNMTPTVHALARAVTSQRLKQSSPGALT